MESSAPVLHDAILLSIGIAAVYLVVAVLQLIQLKEVSTKSARHTREPSLSHVPPADDVALPKADDLAPQRQQGQADAMFKRLDDEVQRLGAELQALRDELQRRDITSLSTSDQAPLKMPAGTHYNEAMVLARAGASATAIALRCNVSLGEAELITALVRGTDKGVHLPHPTQEPDQNGSRLNAQHHDRYRAAA